MERYINYVNSIDIVKRSPRFLPVPAAHYYYNLRALFADPNIEDYPGYKEFAAEEAVEFKRLEALY